MVADGFRLLPASLLRMWKEGAPKSFQWILKKICQSLMTDQPPPPPPHTPWQFTAWMESLGIKTIWAFRRMFEACVPEDPICLPTTWPSKQRWIVWTVCTCRIQALHTYNLQHFCAPLNDFAARRLMQECCSHPFTRHCLVNMRSNQRKKCLPAQSNTRSNE